jgi:hypothetical protein
VNATLRIEILSGDSFELQSLEATLYDTRSLRVASPQRGDVPDLPLRIKSLLELPLSFLTGAGAEVIGGTIRVLATGTDADGEHWQVSIDAVVTR